jgi:hypothetical protein
MGHRTESTTSHQATDRTDTNSAKSEPQVMGAADIFLAVAVMVLPILPYLPWVSEVIAVWITIGIAWLTGALLLWRHCPRKIAEPVIAALTIGFITLGVQAKPTTRRYTGEVSLPYWKELRLRHFGQMPKDPSFEIGESGQVIHWRGVERPLMVFFDQEFSLLDVELVEGLPAVTATVRNHKGDAVATVYRNKWTVNTDQSTAWDFNYTDDSLEITDENRRVLFQMFIESDGTLHLQGEWRADPDQEVVMRNGTPIREVRIVAEESTASLVINPLFLKEDALKCKKLERASGVPSDQPCFEPPPEIERMFLYPGPDYLGERAD